MTRLTLLALALTIILLSPFVNLWRAIDSRTMDFVAFYSGAVLWQQGQNAYDHAEACRVQARVGASVCLPFFHPPVLLPLLSAVSNQDYDASFLRWAAVIFIVTLLCLIPLYYLTGCDVTRTVIMIAFFPVFVGILQGQDTAFVLLGILLCALFLRDGKDTLAGVALGLVVLRPHLAIALAVPLLFARPRAFRAFAIAGAVLVLYSFALVGAEGFRGIIETALLSAQGTDASTKQKAMSNLVGILARQGISPFWAWPFYFASIAGISVLWRIRDATESTFALAIICALFTSPHLHTHDLALLIIPLLAWPAIAVPLVSFGLLIALPFNVGPVFVYVVMLGLALTATNRPLALRVA